MALGITETVLRDANQSLIATRLPLKQFEGILDTLDGAGYYSLECWGGATFDSCIRYLGEDPWERLRIIKKHVKNTKLQMLLRGQNLLGYRHYPDDVVRRFVYQSVKNGIDIIRIFDALNDIGNISTSVEETLRCGAHPSCAIAYTESPVHSIENFVNLALEMEGIGAKSICVKDMSGILAPNKAYELIKSLKDRLSVPVVLHSHCTGGFAYMSYLKAIEAGVDVLDTAISSFSGGTSQPATEVINSVAKAYQASANLDTESLAKINQFFSGVIKIYQDNKVLEYKSLMTDSRIIESQIPGGMYSNLLKQLQDQGYADKFDEVVSEIPEVRKDLGYPPLVTPLSQMVATQAVGNVISGARYSCLCNEVRAYIKGDYGSAPGEISPDVKTLGCFASCGSVTRNNYSWEEEIERNNITYDDDCDILTCILFPQIGEKFLQNRDSNAITETQAEEAPSAAESKDSGDRRDLDLEPDYGSFMDFQNSDGGDSESQQYISAVLPGVVIKIHKRAGDYFHKGDSLLICESMKMENEIIAPTDGKLLKVHVGIGDRVNVNEKLFDIAI